MQSNLEGKDLLIYYFVYEQFLYELSDPMNEQSDEELLLTFIKRYHTLRRLIKADMARRGKSGYKWDDKDRQSKMAKALRERDDG